MAGSTVQFLTDIKNDMTPDTVDIRTTSSLNINPEDEITLPAPISAVRPIIKVERRTDNFGQQCVVVFCGRNRRG